MKEVRNDPYTIAPVRKAWHAYGARGFKHNAKKHLEYRSFRDQVTATAILSYGFHFIFVSPILDPFQSMDCLLKLFERELKLEPHFKEHLIWMTQTVDDLWTIREKIKYMKLVKLVVTSDEDEDSDLDKKNDAVQGDEINAKSFIEDLRYKQDWLKRAIELYRMPSFKPINSFVADVVIIAEMGSYGDAIGAGPLQYYLAGDWKRYMLCTVFIDKCEAINNLKQGTTLFGARVQFQQRTPNVLVLLVTSYKEAKFISEAPEGTIDRRVKSIYKVSLDI